MTANDGDGDDDDDSLSLTSGRPRTFAVSATSFVM